MKGENESTRNTDRNERKTIEKYGQRDKCERRKRNVPDSSNLFTLTLTLSGANYSAEYQGCDYLFRYSAEYFILFRDYQLFRGITFFILAGP